MNGQHRPNPTIISGKIAGGPALNIQAEEKPNTNPKKSAKTMDKPGLLYLLIQLIEKKIRRVDSLSTTLTKTSQRKSLAINQKIGKLYYFAPHQITKHQNRNIQKLHGEMFGHQNHKYGRIPTVRTLDMATIITTKLPGGTTRNHDHSRGNSNCS